MGPIFSLKRLQIVFCRNCVVNGMLLKILLYKNGFEIDEPEGRHSIFLLRFVYNFRQKILNFAYREVRHKCTRTMYFYCFNLSLKK